VTSSVRRPATVGVHPPFVPVRRVAKLRPDIGESVAPGSAQAQGKPDVELR